MNRVIFSILILFVLTLTSAAQTNYQISSAVDFFRTNKMVTGEYHTTLTEDNIDGSPYLNDEFVTGSLFTTAKQQFNDIPLRYNIYNENLEYKNNEDQVLALGSPEIIERAIIGETEMVYIPFASAKKIRRSFFILVSEGDITLYARPQVLYKDPEEPKAFADAVPAKFVKKSDTYYLRNGKNEAIKVDKKKELIDFFPAHNDDIAAFVKKNKIKMKQNDLTKVVEYYNSKF